MAETEDLTLRERTLIEQALGELGGAVAQELNQPLTVLLGYLELLQARPELREDSQIYRTLYSQGRRMADTVRRLSHLLRYETAPFDGPQRVLDLVQASAGAEEDQGEPWCPVVAHRRDGSLVKGSLLRLTTGEGRAAIRSEQGEVEEVELSQLKALFFVRSLQGNPGREEQRAFGERPVVGIKTIVEFEDGEEMWGYTQRYRLGEEVVSLIPADVGSNNLQVFSSVASITGIRFLYQ
ncbi:MAG: hypothetical protein HYY85_14195 [Deltaproteobacteria bacterium]|nr:hypothetical protein [Deltaproteobacteria bacterium]